MAKTSCELCDQPGGELIWQDALCRVVRVDDAHYPGFCRVILNRHVKEMTDLSLEEQRDLMHVVFMVEACVREVVNPDKINLASLGNVVPHLHWHVIPRFKSDRHFPNPIWGESKRETMPHPMDSAVALRLKQVIQGALG